MRRSRSCGSRVAGANLTEPFFFTAFIHARSDSAVRATPADRSETISIRAPTGGERVRLAGANNSLGFAHPAATTLSCSASGPIVYTVINAARHTHDSSSPTGRDVNFSVPAR